MTEPVNKDGQPVEVINNNGQPPVTAPPADEEVWWKEASEKHGFKSKEDVYKSWSESNKKISEQGEKLKDFELFQNNVVPVLDIVLQDEEILGKVKAKMENPNAPIKPVSQVDNPKVPTEDADTKKYLIDNAVKSFEQSHGIDKLDEETQKDIKAKIGVEFKKFTSETGIKVNLVGGQLEDAFALAIAKNPKLAEVFAPKDEALSDYGSMPSQSSGLDKDGNIRLTPEQEKVAERMPGGREAYIKGLKKVQAK
jgi:predicted small metal-binding protein